jgi:hypothetical protein
MKRWSKMAKLIGLLAFLGLGAAWAAGPVPAATSVVKPGCSCAGWLSCCPGGAAEPGLQGEVSTAALSGADAPALPEATGAAPEVSLSEQVPGVAAPAAEALGESLPERPIEVAKARTPSPPVSPMVTLFSHPLTSNPAAPAVLWQKTSGWGVRMGLISLGGGYEIGKLDDIDERIEAVSDQISVAQRFEVSNNATEEEARQAIVAQANNELIDPVNEIFAILAKDGQGAVFGNAHVPLTPFVISAPAWGGTVVVDARFNLITGVHVVSTPLVDVVDTDINVTGAPGNFDASLDYDPSDNDTSMLVRAALVKEFGVGYSRDVWTPEGGAGTLSMGGRIKYYEVELGREAIKLTDDSDFEDAFDGGSSTVKSRGVGLDVGALWSARHYRAGGWINNLNSPEFKYNALDLSGYTHPDVIVELSGDKVFIMKPQFQVEGALYTENRHWVLDMGLDVNAVQDPVGREFQWVAVNGAYIAGTALVPGVRVGYRENLAGTRLSYATAGLSWLGVNLDVAYGLEKVQFGGNAIPRSFMLNISSSMTF